MNLSSDTYICLVSLVVECATSGASTAGTVAMQSESDSEINP